MNVTLCMANTDNTSCISPEPCMYLNENETWTSGCFSTLNNPSTTISTTSPTSSLLSTENLNAGLIAFFFFILTCIFLGLVYGIAVIVQNEYKSRSWNNMEVQRTTAEIYCDDDDIEMTPVTYKAQTC